MSAPPAGASGAERGNTRWGEILSYRPVYSVLALLLAWEVASRLALINPYFLPAPSLVIERAYQILLGEKLLQHLAGTLLRSLAALVLCVAIGVPLGVAMARIAAVRWFFDPLISLGLPVPKIALWPIFVLWFAFRRLQILLTTFACAFPVVSATYLGTRNVDKFVVWSAPTLARIASLALESRSSRRRCEILTGIQTVLPIAIIIVVLTEMLSGGGAHDHVRGALRRHQDRSGRRACRVADGLWHDQAVRTVAAAAARLAPGNERDCVTSQHRLRL
jgi:ABC-type nitrate/sulfonate/bicarbonate transport system permease component